MQSRYYDERRAQSRAPIYMNPYASPYAMMPPPFSERDVRVGEPPVWGVPSIPMPVTMPQMPQMPPHMAAMYGGMYPYMASAGMPAPSMGYHVPPDCYRTHPYDVPAPNTRVSQRKPSGTRSDSDDRRDRGEGQTPRGRPSNVYQPLLDFPSDPDVRGFEDYKKKWDQGERHEPESTNGWGPQASVRYDPLLMWSKVPEPAQAQHTSTSPIKRSSSPIKQEYGISETPEQRSDEMQVVEPHVPPAYDTSNPSSPPPDSTTIGIRGRVYPDRDRSLSPIPSFKATIEDEYDWMRYKRDDRFRFTM
ncbi:hypothetical protein DFS34DRAFT_27246 [Phlyctochytrium arcticum]|nr:hypothetical protein DFS34DRAFT_27246 [Phlyctochytrium arcticum]